MNANVRIKFSADTSDIDSKLKSYAGKSASNGGATQKEFDSQVKAYEKHLDKLQKLTEKQEQYLQKLRVTSLAKANAEEEKALKQSESANAKALKTKESQDAKARTQEINELKKQIASYISARQDGEKRIGSWRESFNKEQNARLTKEDISAEKKRQSELKALKQDITSRSSLKGGTVSLDSITAQRLKDEESAHALHFKSLEKQYESHSKKVVDLKTQLKRTENEIEREKITKEIQEEERLTAVFRKEYQSRSEVAHKGAGAEHGIMGIGRELIGASGFGGALLGGGAAVALGIGLKEGIEGAAAFETALTRLSNITGISGHALDALGEKLHATALKYNTDLPDAVAATEGVLRSLGEEFKKNMGATDSVTQSVLTLSKAQGITAEESTAVLTGTLHQFGLATGTADQQATSLAKIMNIFAAATQNGTAKMPELTEGMKAAGIMAHALGISVEETAAAIEVLSTNEVSGAEAGGKLALLFTKLSAGTPVMQHALARLGLTYEDINPEKVGLNKALTTLKEKLDAVGNPVNRVEIETQLFGQGAHGAIKTYEALSQNIKQLDETKTKITDTKVAQEQLNKVLETAEEKYKHDKVELSLMAESIGKDVIPMIVKMEEAVRDSIKGWKELILLMNKIPGLNPQGRAQDKADQASEGFSAMTKYAEEMIKAKTTNRQGAFNMLRQYIIGSHNDLGTPQFDETDKKHITDLVDGMIAETNKVVEDKTTNKDPKFGGDFKKNKKDLAKIAYDEEIGENKALFNAKLILLYSNFTNEKDFADRKLKYEEENRKADLIAVQHYYDYLGIELDKHDKDYQALLIKGIEEEDKIRLEELAKKKKDADFSVKIMFDQMDKEIKFLNAETAAKDALQKEIDKKTQKRQKAADDEYDLAIKHEDELLKVFSGSAEKAFSTWETEFFRPMDEEAARTKNVMLSMISDILKGLIKLAENRALAAIENAIFGLNDSKPDKQGSNAADFIPPVLNRSFIKQQGAVNNNNGSDSGVYSTDNSEGGFDINHMTNSDFNRMKHYGEANYYDPSSSTEIKKSYARPVKRGQIGNGSGAPDGEITQGNAPGTIVDENTDKVISQVKNIYKNNEKFIEVVETLEAAAHGHPNAGSIGAFINNSSDVTSKAAIESSMGGGDSNDKDRQAQQTGVTIAQTLLKAGGAAKKQGGITAGQGVSVLGSVLSAIPGLGIFGSILSGVGGLFAEGGYTGGKPGEVRGLVHGDEHVFTSPQLTSLFNRIQNTGGNSANMERMISKISQPQIHFVPIDTYGVSLSSERSAASRQLRAMA